MNRLLIAVVCLLTTVASAVGQTTRARPATRPGTRSAAPVEERAFDALGLRLVERTAPSLVVVQYTWESEAGSRELAGLGVVVRPEGLVMSSLGLAPAGVPDAQMKDFKIIVPRRDQDHLELEAIFLGRDERTNLAFFQTRQKQDWTPIRFIEAAIAPGDVIYSVGLLPKPAGYHAYLARSMVSAVLRGEVPQVMCLPGLTGVGSPVFNTQGQAIGFANAQSDQPLLLHDSRNPQAGIMPAINNPPNFFVPTRDFLQGLQDPPIAGQPPKLPWTGLTQLHGLKSEVAELFGLTNTPAVEVGEVLPDTPAEKAGFKRQMIIVRLNGQALERGDEPDELPGILRRKILRMKVGEPVTFSVLVDKDQPLRDITLTLEERPKGPNLADRYFAEDLGFVTRDLVFGDTYRKRLPPSQPGVLVAWVKPQSAAESGKLANDDLITEFNRQKVGDVAAFKKAYETFRRDFPREAVVMVVKREGTTQVIRIEPPQ